MDRVFKVVREARNGPDLDKWERAQLRKHELAMEKAKQREEGKPVKKRTPKKGEEKQIYICGRCVKGYYDLDRHVELVHDGKYK